MSVYDYSVKDQKGSDVSLKQYEGKVLLIVNTATGCGFTPQYEGLEDLYLKYHDQGFEILDFPCNQFGHQAPGSDEEINTFCTMKYATTFPRFKKIDVNEENEDKLYTYLKSQKGGLFNRNIKWNFTKFLIGRNGEVISRFPPTVEPKSIATEIEKALEAK